MSFGRIFTLDENVIFERYKEEQASFIDANGVSRHLWENRFGTDQIMELSFYSYWYYLWGLFFGACGAFMLTGLVDAIFSKDMGLVTFNFLLQNKYWVIGITFLVWHYKFQERKVRQIQFLAANTYFSEGIDQAYRQLYLCSKNLSEEEFTALLNTKFTHEKKIDLICQKKQKMLKNGELKYL